VWIRWLPPRLGRRAASFPRRAERDERGEALRELCGGQFTNVRRDFDPARGKCSASSHEATRVSRYGTDAQRRRLGPIGAATLRADRPFQDHRARRLLRKVVDKLGQSFPEMGNRTQHRATSTSTLMAKIASGAGQNRPVSAPPAHHSHSTDDGRLVQPTTQRTDLADPASAPCCSGFAAGGNSAQHHPAALPDANAAAALHERPDSKTVEPDVRLTDPLDCASAHDTWATCPRRRGRPIASFATAASHDVHNEDSGRDITRHVCASPIRPFRSLFLRLQDTAPRPAGIVKRRDRAPLSSRLCLAAHQDRRAGSRRLFFRAGCRRDVRILKAHTTDLPPDRLVEENASLGTVRHTTVTN